MNFTCKCANEARLAELEAERIAQGAHVATLERALVEARVRLGEAERLLQEAGELDCNLYGCECFNCRARARCDAETKDQP